MKKFQILSLGTKCISTFLNFKTLILNYYNSTKLLFLGIVRETLDLFLVEFVTKIFNVQLIIYPNQLMYILIGLMLAKRPILRLKKNLLCIVFYFFICHLKK